MTLLMGGDAQCLSLWTSAALFCFAVFSVVVYSPMTAEILLNYFYVFEDLRTETI